MTGTAFAWVIIEPILSLKFMRLNSFPENVPYCGMSVAYYLLQRGVYSRHSWVRMQKGSLGDHYG